MNGDKLYPYIEPELEARIVALVLGEASDFEREELERLIAESPELAVFKKRIETTHGLLKEVALGEVDDGNEEWKLPAERRDAVLAAIDGAPGVTPSNVTTAPVRKSRGVFVDIRWSRVAAFAAVACITGAAGSMLFMPGMNLMKPDATGFATARVEIQRESEDLDLYENALNREQFGYVSDSISVVTGPAPAIDPLALVAVAETEVDYRSALKALDATLAIDPGVIEFDGFINYGGSIKSGATKGDASGLTALQTGASAPSSGNRSLEKLRAVNTGLMDMDAEVGAGTQKSPAPSESKPGAIAMPDISELKLGADFARDFGREKAVAQIDNFAEVPVLREQKAYWSESKGAVVVDSNGVVDGGNAMWWGVKADGTVGEEQTRGFLGGGGAGAGGGAGSGAMRESKSLARMGDLTTSDDLGVADMPVLESAPENGSRFFNSKTEKAKPSLGKNPVRRLATLPAPTAAPAAPSAPVDAYAFEIRGPSSESDVKGTEKLEKPIAAIKLQSVAAVDAVAAEPLPKKERVTLNQDMASFSGGAVVAELSDREEVARVDGLSSVKKAGVVPGQAITGGVQRMAKSESLGELEDLVSADKGRLNIMADELAVTRRGQDGLERGNFVAGEESAMNESLARGEVPQPVQKHSGATSGRRGGVAGDDPLPVAGSVVVGRVADWQDVAETSDPFGVPEPSGTTSLSTRGRIKEGVVLPEVSFQDTPLDEALAYLKKKSAEMDPDGEGVNIVEAPTGFDSEGEQPRITLDLTNVPLEEALRYTTELAGRKYKVEADSTVTVVPLSDVGEDLQTRVYRVPPTFLAAADGGDESMPNDPFAPANEGEEAEIREEAAAKKVLEGVGITFPPGASAFYDPKTSQLVVRNTASNTELVDAYVVSAVETAPVTPMIRLREATELRERILGEISESWESKAPAEIAAKVASLEDELRDGRERLEELTAKLGNDAGKKTPEQAEYAHFKDAYEAQKEMFMEMEEALENKRAEVKKVMLLKKAAPPTGLDEKNASEEAFSTFSLHVSDVSFKLAQAALAKGEWPEASKIRVEEFVNAFDYGDPMPSQQDRVGCRLEQSIQPFLQQRNLLRVSMQTAAAGRAGDTPLRLTFLLDNSGSMERIDRQETVRRAFALLADQLQPIDQVTLISFARQPRLVADRVGGERSRELVDLVANLPSEGGTNLEAALQLAFEKAREQQVDGAQNRIVMLTDGAANLGDAEPESLAGLIESMRDSGIAFDAAGIGADGLNDDILEALTRKGDGRYYLLDRPEDADDGFARQIAGALRPAAKNVKVQVEFNAKRVGRYKLIGFEKHRLEKEDFRNDSVDAAEMAAEEAGVAVYQFEPLPGGEGDVGSVSVRFRDLSTGEMIEKRWPIPYDGGVPQPDRATPSMRIATAAAMFGSKLKGDALGGSVELDALAELLSGLPKRYEEVRRVQELRQMIDQAREMSGE